jgi:uncharacterized membrane protein YccC
MGFWQTVVKFERDKIAPGQALRNCLGVVIPIAIGISIRQPAGGLIAATGALNVCFSDGPEPYWQRGRRMLIASVLVALAVFVGGVSGRNDVLAVLVAGAWAFAAGMLVSLGTEAADLGTVSLVTLVVFGAQRLHPKEAAISGLLAFAGGLLQTGMALALWPVRRYEPERRELGALYQELGNAMAAHIEAGAAPPATAEMVKAQKALSTIGFAHTIESERYLALLNQAERMRLSILALARLRARIRRDAGGAAYTETLNQFFACASRTLLAVGTSLVTNDALAACADETARFSRDLRAEEDGALGTLLRDARWQVDALAGQLRSAADLAGNATAAGTAAFEEREAKRQWRLRIGGTLATLRANLTFRSAACRHAIRLAVTVALGDAMGRMASLQRPYWIPMTIAIVLKPDFTSTFSRGVLRLVGTFAGLAFATVLFHVMAPNLAVQVALIGVFVFILRWVGGANYGIFVAAVSALVVLLLAITGIQPQMVIAARAWNTVAGGAVALLAYIVWPTWERTHVGEAIAGMLDSYRDYFRSVALAYFEGATDRTAELDRTREAARLARSNAEASVDKVATEPFTRPDAIEQLHSILANSHRLVHAVMALEAGLAIRDRPPARNAFRTLAHHVEFTMHALAEALRGANLNVADLADLREDHQRLLESGASAPERYALSNIETDRVVNSLNTLTEQVVLWTSR